jgi:hypothetical protein
VVVVALVVVAQAAMVEFVGLVDLADWSVV